MNFLTDFRKILNLEFHENMSKLEPSCFMRTKGRTDRRDEADSRFSQFCKRA